MDAAATTPSSSQTQRRSPPANLQQHPLHNRHHVLTKYTTALMQLRKVAERTQRIRPFYFDNFIVHHYFQTNSNNNKNANDTGDERTVGLYRSMSLAFLRLELLKQIRDRRRQITFYILLCFLCFLAYRHEANAKVSMAERSMHYVYPSMRMWRRITLPLIQRFPRLTELYDETCLMENPFFQIDDLSCEPCEHVQGVLDQSQMEGVSFGIGQSRGPESEMVPFVFKINRTPIKLSDFYTIYASNQKIFQRDAYRVQSTNNDITNLHELFSQFNHTRSDDAVGEDELKASSSSIPRHNSHSLWRCNRMLPARLLRQLFTHSEEHLPTTGIALERYMSIDTPQAPTYALPDTECANVVVQQALGTRFIILRPTSSCRHRCRTISVRLPQSFVLSYNWWYWKPVSAPDPLSESLSISLIGSYC